MIACNANTTRHYIPRIPSELNKKEEERTNTFKKKHSKESAAMGNGIQEGGSDSNTYPNTTLT